MKLNHLSFRIGLVIMMVVYPIGCEQETIVPQHFRGVWKTSTPKFSDRYLKFTDHLLIFGVGNGEEVQYPIRKIEVLQLEGNKTLYTFHYVDSEGEKWTFILTYNPSFGGTIQLKNRAEIWKISN